MYRIFLCSLVVVSFNIQAGGFDSSNRPFDIIFGEENAFEFSLSYFSPSVSLAVAACNHNPYNLQSSLIFGPD